MRNKILHIMHIVIVIWLQSEYGRTRLVWVLYYLLCKDTARVKDKSTI